MFSSRFWEGAVVLKRILECYCNHDFFKMDIEGNEQLLLNCDCKLKPCVIEVHNFGLWDIGEKLMQRFRALRITQKGRDTMILQSSESWKPSKGIFPPVSIYY